MLAPINTGKLDTLITIESITTVKNSIGENESTWSVLKTTNAEVEWLPTGETFEGKQETDLQSIKVKIRFDDSITSLMRVRLRQETTFFYIRSVQKWRREGSTIFTAVQRDNE